MSTLCFTFIDFTGAGLMNIIVLPTRVLLGGKIEKRVIPA